VSPRLHRREIGRAAFRHVRVARSRSRIRRRRRSGPGGSTRMRRGARMELKGIRVQASRCEVKRRRVAMGRTELTVEHLRKSGGRLFAGELQAFIARATRNAPIANHRYTRQARRTHTSTDRSTQQLVAVIASSLQISSVPIHHIAHDEDLAVFVGRRSRQPSSVSTNCAGKSALRDRPIRPDAA